MNSAGRWRRQEIRRSGACAPRLTRPRKCSHARSVVDLHHGDSCGRDVDGARPSRHRSIASADAYLVRRGAGRTIIAGYPWFTDWGRDTFIAVRGLCLATGRLSDARDILVEWAGAVSEGMLPNRFPDHGEAPEFNAVDASLWYVVAVDELLSAVGGRSAIVSRDDRKALEIAIVKIVAGYAAGTRFGIRMDDDGLLAAGVPGVQLTWMDARVGDRVITPRIGKPVEIQALWLNALNIAGALDPRWREPFERGMRSFPERFWNDERGHLADVVDVDHVSGTRDDTCRPNQILAVGGLPIALVAGERARRVVECRRAAPVDADRPAIAGAWRIRLCAALRGRLARLATRCITRARCGRG